MENCANEECVNGTGVRMSQRQAEAVRNSLSLITLLRDSLQSKNEELAGEVDGLATYLDGACIVANQIEENLSFAYGEDEDEFAARIAAKAKKEE